MVEPEVFTVALHRIAGRSVSTPSINGNTVRVLEVYQDTVVLSAETQTQLDHMVNVASVYGWSKSAPKKRSGK
jgi:hypothetical protein